MTPPRRLLPAGTAAAVLAAVLVAAGCGSGGSGSAGDGAITVDSGDSTCTLSATEATAGSVTFSVTNSGGKVTEFYVYAEDGKRIVGEVENIGPGLTRDLTVDVEPGTYVTACKPGMSGAGIRADLVVG